MKETLTEVWGFRGFTDEASDNGEEKMVSGLNLLGASQGTAGWRQGAKQGDQAQQSIIQMSRVRARLLNSNVRDTRFLKNRFLLE